MELSENFTAEELSTTTTGVYNTPGQVELEKLLYLANFLLQPIRNKFGKIQVTSGFRSKQVNEVIGGVTTSQHMLGEAVDFIPMEATIEDVFDWAKDNLIYGQIIIELKGGKRWIHISLPRLAKQNMMALSYTDGIYTNAHA